MNIPELRKVLNERSTIVAPDGWMKSLPDRKKKEIEFHNDYRKRVEGRKKPENKKYYTATSLSTQYREDWFRNNVSQKVFLDYACGDGDNVLKAARHGAALSIGLDISDVSIRNARQAAGDADLADRCVFIQGDCEKTGLPDECVDVIYCGGMLHHLDLSYAFPEMRRLLKPGGKILAFEALAYNPFIQLYRRLTPSFRTRWEEDHILSLSEVAFAKRFFNLGEVRFWHLLSILASFFREGPVSKAALAVLNRVDSVVLKIPGIRLLSWQFSFELIKRPEK